MDPNQPPPLPIVEYDTPPRADRVTRVKYQTAIVVTVVFGAVVAGILLMLLTQRRSVRVSTTFATPAPAAMPAPVRVAPSPATEQQQIEQWHRQNNEKRVADLLVDSPPATAIVYTEDPVEARRLFGNGLCTHQASRRDMNQPFFSAFEPPVFRTDGFSSPNPRQEEQEPALLFAHALTAPAETSGWCSSTWR